MQQQKNPEITDLVYEARKFQTPLYVVSTAPKPDEEGTMGKMSDRSSSCFYFIKYLKVHQ